MYINHHEPSIVRGGMIVARSEAIPFSVPASNYLATALRLTNTPTARGPVASLWGEAVGMLGKTWPGKMGDQVGMGSLGQTSS